MFRTQGRNSRHHTNRNDYPTMGAKGGKSAWEDDQPATLSQKVLPVDSKVGSQPRLLTLEQVLVMANISRSYLHALRKDRRCPAPIKLSPSRRGAVRFVAAEVEAWIASWMASRPDEKDGTPNDLPGV